MSHALTAPSGRTYFHNGDFSGGFDVYLTPQEAGTGGEKVKVTIPSRDVIALAAAMVRSGLAGFSESAPDEALVALLAVAGREA